MNAIEKDLLQKRKQKEKEEEKEEKELMKYEFYESEEVEFDESEEISAITPKKAGVNRDGEINFYNKKEVSNAKLFSTATKKKRSRKYRTPEQLQRRMNQYFELVEGDVPTVTDLATFLGMSRQNLDSYAKINEEFEWIISIAKSIIAGDKERKALVGDYHPGMVQFMLKNQHGFSDVKEIKQEVNINQFENISNKELAEISKEIIEADWEEI